MNNKWKTKKLEEVVEHSKGKRPKNLGGKTKEREIPYIDIKAFEKGILRKFSDLENTNIAVKTDTLVVWDGARFGLSGSNVEGAVGSTIMKLTPKDIIRPKFLSYFIKSKYSEIQANPRGVGIPHVEPAVFWNFKIKLPPKNVQNRINDKLDSLFSKIDAGEAGLKKMEKQLEVYRKAILKKAFGKKDGWKKYKWEEVVKKMTGGGTPSKKETKYWNGDIPWASVKDITGWTINETQDFITERGLENSSTKLIPENRIIIVTRISLGKGFITSFPVAINQDLKALEINTDIVSLDFFKWWYISIERLIQSMGRGTTVQGVRIEDLNSLEISIPEKNRQEEIVEYIETQMSKMEYLQKSIELTRGSQKILRQSILKKAFNGELI